MILAYVIVLVKLIIIVLYKEINRFKSISFNFPTQIFQIYNLTLTKKSKPNHKVVDFLIAFYR